MGVMKLIACSKSSKHQILFNSFIFRIALRNKHFKVNIFSEGSLCGLIRVLQKTTNFFFPPLLNIFLSFFSKAAFLVFFFFLYHAFSHSTFTFSHISGYVCTCTHMFSFQASWRKKKNLTLATELSSAVMLQTARLSLPALQVKKLLPAAALNHPQAWEDIPVHIWKASNNSHRN